MANLLSTLTRIEPTRGLIDYVTTVKPYHTKILDIQIEYIYTDVAVGSATDRDEKVIAKYTPVIDPLFADCGYGSSWDSSNSLLQRYTIGLANKSSETNPDSNSFVINTQPLPVFNFFTLSTSSNRFKLGTSREITSANINNSTFFIGDDVSMLVKVGDSVGVNISRSMGSPINKQYTVTSVVVSLGNTTIGVSTPIPAQQIYPGTMCFFTTATDVPFWMTKPSLVDLSSTGTLPFPLLSAAQYYVVPTDVAGEFNLAITRYPVQYFQYVDIRDFGSLTLSIQLAEPFAPNDQVSVSNTFQGINDGLYTIESIVQSGATYKIFTYEKITKATPLNVTLDGDMVLRLGGYDSAVECPLARASDLYARGRISELLEFQFALTESDNGAGEAIENPPIGGYSTSEFDNSGGWDEFSDNYLAQTVLGTSLIAVPAGFDTLFFDVSAFDSVTINPHN